MCWCICVSATYVCICIYIHTHTHTAFALYDAAQAWRKMWTPPNWLAFTCIFSVSLFDNPCEYLVLVHRAGNPLRYVFDLCDVDIFHTFLIKNSTINLKMLQNSKLYYAISTKTMSLLLPNWVTNLVTMWFVASAGGQHLFMTLYWNLRKNASDMEAG